MTFAIGGWWWWMGGDTNIDENDDGAIRYDDHSLVDPKWWL